MSEGPNTWNIGDAIIIEMLIVSPTTGLGLSGQKSYIEVTIQRDSDEKWWTGVQWSATRTTLEATEEDSTNQPGRYTYTLPGAVGNIQEDRYVAHAKVDNAPTVEGSAYEAHISREQDVRVYETIAV